MRPRWILAPLRAKFLLNTSITALGERRPMRAVLFAAAALSLVALAAPAWSVTERVGDYVTRPDWKRRPDADDLKKLYPREANGATGQTAASCLIDAKGAVSDCTVIHEAPLGLGFGDATLKLARKFRLRTLDGDGQPVAGRRVNLPVTWYGTYAANP